MIPYYVPTVPDVGLLSSYLEEINQRKWLTNFGPLSDKLAAQLSNLLGHQHILPVSSCTNGLMTCFMLLGCKSVVTTPFSFVATSSSLKWMGIQTHFVDIDPDSKNICPKALEQYLSKNQGKVDAVVATHVYGNPCDVAALDRLAKDYDVKIIYDAAHAFDVKVDDRSVLMFGELSVLSFHATKIFHSVEGGAIAVPNEEVFERARKIINFGIDRSAEVTEIGINSKMSEYHAAVGLVQMRTIERVKKHRISLYERYIKHFQGRVEIQQWHSKSSPNGAYMPIFLESAQQRAKVVKALDSQHVGYKQYFYKNLNCSMFGESDQAPTPNAQHACDTVVCLPIYFDLSMNDVDAIAQTVLEAVK
ncbi:MULTISPECIES: DegT/DnrJ/EryC1/StrS aminotransferase family protein [Gammaproteobacteria]|uniref:DegT/DnrJ/EryC1/StrS family aminotransferase n=1 Tax=Gammaproteobacteria TaxID=1236 RepID=UPI001403FCE2|nr:MULTISPECIES: DegT/DnrJ/EryC1/StrS family aminotransferase [Gammaproteobacteria]